MEKKRERKFRFELLDKDSNLLHEDFVAESGTISYQSPNPIQRGGSIRIDGDGAA